MFMQFEKIAGEGAESGPVGLFVDAAGGYLRLRWPRDVAEFPFGVAWVELLWDDWIEAQGLMPVALNGAGTHYEGAIPLDEFAMTPAVAEGLRAEACAIREDDLDLVSPAGIERLLEDCPQDAPRRAPLDRLLRAVRHRTQAAPSDADP